MAIKICFFAHFTLLLCNKTKHKRMKSNKGNTATSGRPRNIIKVLWIGNAVFVAICVVLWLLIYNGIIGYMPPVKDLRNPNDKYATRLFTADGLDSDVRSDEMLVDHYPTDKPESQRVLVHTNKDAVSLTDRDCLFVGVDFDIPRS